MIEKIVSKLLSGKFLLTLTCAIAFVYCVMAKRIPDAAIVGIIMMVFTAYFNKKNGGDNEVK